jgi:DNA repair exonuclease SbcCD ATPase subunit
LAPAGSSAAPELEDLAELADRITEALGAEMDRRQQENAHLEALLETIFRIAALDFSSKAPVLGNGPVDAVALSVNMLAEELDAAQRELKEAKAVAEAAAQEKGRFLAQSEARAAELEQALSRIRGLEGIIPICMHCHRIREGVDEWHRLEKYISEHSDARFSHGICPGCMEKHYGNLGLPTNGEVG